MRHPTLALTVVPSEALPGTLSVHVSPDDRSGTAFRHALTSAGFLPGDRVVLGLEGNQVLALLAVAFNRELRDGIAQKDPAGFVQRWMSVVAELDSQ